MKTKQQRIIFAARRLSNWCKQIVALGPQGAARYIMLDDLRKQLNKELKSKDTVEVKPMSVVNNHQICVAFSIETENDSESITTKECIAGLEKRLAELKSFDETEALEAFEVCDTYEVK